MLWLHLSAENGTKLKDVTRRLNRLRHNVYHQTPIARRSSAGDAASALWRAYNEKGFNAWCYEFGFSSSLTHTVTIVEADDRLWIHDAFFNLTYPAGLHEILDALRGGIPVTAKAEIRDRKIYIVDPAFEAEKTVTWLKANADRELAPTNGSRRFEVLWTLDAFAATAPGIEPAYRDLEDRGHPRDLRFLMLHPIEIFDGRKSHRDIDTMPLLGGRDLGSPLAALSTETRRMRRELEAERERAKEKNAVILRLKDECDAAKSRLSEASSETMRLGAQIVQLRAALDDESARATASEAEIAALRAELSGARAEWDAERHSLECSLASVHATAGLWIEENSHAVGRLKFKLDAAVGEREQAVAERDLTRAELASRLHTWENSRWRNLRALFMRGFARPRQGRIEKR